MGREAKYDIEVINIFALYLEKQQNMIFIPELLQRFNAEHPDPEVDRELAKQSLATVIRHVCKVICELKRASSDYFKGALNRTYMETKDLLLTL